MNYTNDLIHESSPYLLQHAHNPVEWHAWNENNLREAQALKRPLLISIGYSACHWCHVMEHESFENEEVASLMNQHFYCIKVDREERTDVDHLYMNAVQMITGRGGWPLNCFAFPDGRPFHGGTYFPKESWIKVLQAVHHEFTNNPEKLESYAARLKMGLTDQSAIPLLKSDGIEPLTKLDKAVLQWSSQMDHEWGGQQGAPKFPMPANWSFLMYYGHQRKNEGVLNHVDLTLKSMDRGGIYDQLAGGFARYSVDAHWKIPHFEKMLYDNGQLLELCSQAYKRTNDPEYKRVVMETSTFLLNELQSDDGLFYSALDADSEGVEGKYYVWTKQELQTVLKDEYALAEAAFALDERAYWEDNLYVLLAVDRTLIAEDLGLSEEELDSQLRNIRSTLLNVRGKRIRPGLDDKALLSWNAMAIKGLLCAAQATGIQDYRDAAVTCAKAIQTCFVQPEGMKRTFKNGTAAIEAFSEDVAWLISAWIDLYQDSGELNWLNDAYTWMQEALRTFYDGDQGFFLYRPVNQTELVHNAPEIYDNVIPSSNSVMCRNLLWLSRFYHRPDFRSMADDMMNRVLPIMEAHPSAFGNWMWAILERWGTNHELVITGEYATDRLAELQSQYIPGCVVASTNKPSDLPLFQHRFQSDVRYFVCEQSVCRQPVMSGHEALVLIRREG
ncbi:MAG: thioredoxin domain-containing protein [Flavobacteriales bacterium]|nr:thioredoxin domain-containing protein [Flavobacteriales bacterium]